MNGPRQETHSGGRGLQLALVLVFVATLLAPWADALLRPAAARSPLVEGRTPEPAPRLEPSLASWSTFPERFEAWHADVFGLRDAFLRAHNAWKIFGLGTSPAPQFVLGRERWLFTTVAKTFESWRGVFPLGAAELEAWRGLLEQRRAWLRRRGIEYLFVVVPSKQELYPEVVPRRISKVGPARLDQLLEHLERTSDLRLLDLRPALLAAKAADEGADFAYFPLGTHWTPRGAVAGVRAILDALRPLLPALPVLADGDLEWEPGDEGGDSLAPNLYLGDVLRQSFRRCRLREPLRAGWTVADVPEGHRRKRVTRDAPGLPSAIVFHDSFGEALYDLLPFGFSSTTFEWFPTMDRALIKREQPTVVIQVFVDRVLGSPPASLEDPE